MASKKENDDEGKEIFDDKIGKAKLIIKEAKAGYSFLVDYDNGTRTEKGSFYPGLRACMSRAIIQRQKMLRVN